MSFPIYPAIYPLHPSPPPLPPPKKKVMSSESDFFLFLPTKLYVYILCFISCINAESKEEGKYQESIQLSTTPDLGHHMGSKKNTRIHHIQKGQEVRVSSVPFSDNIWLQNKKKQHFYKIKVLFCFVFKIKCYLPIQLYKW